MTLHMRAIQQVRDGGVPAIVTALSVELGRLSAATCNDGNTYKFTLY